MPRSDKPQEAAEDGQQEDENSGGAYPMRRSARGVALILWTGRMRKKKKKTAAYLLELDSSGCACRAAPLEAPGHCG